MSDGSAIERMFMPHGQCFLWEPGVLWLNVSSDLIITIAYYVISASLFYLLYKRKDVPFKWMFVLFGLFIFACGTTHVMHVWTVWYPDYWMEGMVKAGTAALSLSTGLLLVPLLPKAMALRSPVELEELNASLRTALAQRQDACDTLQASQVQLVRHTEELTQQRDKLRRMASQLTMTEQRERRRVANDLHDYLAQLLVVCRLKVSHAQKDSASLPVTFFEDLNGSLDQCLRYTRTLVSQLCPTALYEAGLVVALQQLATHMDKHGLHVRVVAADPVIPLDDDEAILLYQTARELLFNVLKHARTTEAEVRIRKTASNDIEVVVEDHGVGFDQSLPGDRSAAERFGLLSVRERIEALDGRFDLRSTPGSGTIATLVLPLPEAPEPGEDPPPSFTLTLPGSGPDGEAADDRILRVLLVDDHAMVRQGLRSVLEAYADVEVVGEARDGMEALHCVETLRPSVTIMDINMPKMDGIEATRRIKARYPNITIIGLSVNAGSDQQSVMLEAGAAALLTKEAAVEQLYTAIRQAIVRNPVPDSSSP